MQKDKVKKINWVTKFFMMRLISYAMSLNRDDFHVFVHYSGHVDTFEISVHRGGWSTQRPPLYLTTDAKKGSSVDWLTRRTIYLSSTCAPVLNLKCLRAMRKQLNALSNYKNLPPVLAGQKFKVIDKDNSVLCHMFNKQDAELYAQRRGGVAVPSDWQVFTPMESVH